ncbi:hypothetical protein [Bradyrhizobium sp. S69]|uniref:hypothetical protein n=1 Tax=Bradyrhizobium sp. S69 TaxID=1641856 RepID=UPI00131EC81F|nr:hypothetical protein [Bradyrhizobium sp. S69]
MKAMLPTPTPLESETALVLEVPKIASAVWAFGTVAGFQLPAVFQSPLPGEASQVCAWADAGQKIGSNANTATMASFGKYKLHRKQMPETDERPKNKFASNVCFDPGRCGARRRSQNRTPKTSNPSYISNVFQEIGLDRTSPVRTGRHCSTIERRCGR